MSSLYREGPELYKKTMQVTAKLVMPEANKSESKADCNALYKCCT